MTRSITTMARRAAASALLAALAMAAAAAAALEGDREPTAHGDLVIQPLLHGTFGLEWNGQIVYVDPYGGDAVFEGLPAADLVVVTDIHGDHMDPASLELVVKDRTLLVAPRAVHDALPEPMQRRTRVMRNGERIELAGIGIEAVPMYNLPETPESRHPKGRGNGYVLDFAGTRVYVSGDTHDIPEMRALRDIDVAFVCMNPPNTMSVEQAADAVLEFRPRIVYPFHFRSRQGFSDVQAFERLVAADPAIEVRQRRWYP
ncbi:MAG TPA: MBL fold metallo-hydrolase [Pseudomonadales bacterium]